MERDYAELIKALRFAFDQPCYSCVLGEKCNWGDFCFFKRSADAIEELLKENGELENSGRVLMAAFARLKEKVPTWISVEERLPEKHVEVLICTEDYGKNELGFANTAVWDGSEWIETWNRKESIPYVSHWMPLPVPPKEVE